MSAAVLEPETVEQLPPERDPVCHIGEEVIAPGLYVSLCGKPVAEPHCCTLGHPKCGRPTCEECAAIKARY